MAESPKCTVYIGNLDERVSDRVLYDILIQAGHVIDLHMPRDKETNRAKGFAFAEYETEEVAEYAVKLFSGLVTLYNRTLKFAISGQDKPSSNAAAGILHPSNSSLRNGPYSTMNSMNFRYHSTRLSSSHLVNYEQGASNTPPGVGREPNAYRSHYDGYNNEYSQRVLGTSMDNLSRSRSSRHYK